MPTRPRSFPRCWQPWMAGWRPLVPVGDEPFRGRISSCPTSPRRSNRLNLGAPRSSCRFCRRGRGGPSRNVRDGTVILPWRARLRSCFVQKHATWVRLWNIGVECVKQCIHKAHLVGRVIRGVHEAGHFGMSLAGAAQGIDRGFGKCHDLVADPTGKHREREI